MKRKDRKPKRVYPPLTEEQQRLVEGAMKYAHCWAHRYCKRYRDRSDFTHLLDEYYSAGVMGLCIAASKFEPERGFAFLTYATNWIRQQMQLLRLDLHPLGRAAARRHAPEPVMSVGARERGKFANLDEPTFEPEARPEPVNAEDYHSDRLMEIIQQCRNDRERKILMLYFIDEMTLREIGEVTGISRERVRQLLEKSCRRLQNSSRIQEIDRAVRQEAMKA